MEHKDEVTNAVAKQELLDEAEFRLAVVLELDPKLSVESLLHGLACVLSDRTNDPNINDADVNALQRTIKAILEAKRVAEANQL